MRCAVLAAAAALPFLRTLHDPFVGDDFGHLALFSHKPPLHVLSLFTMPWSESIYGGWTDELRPTLALSLQWDWYWGDGAPFAFHLGNILYHVLNTWLVYGVAREAAGLSPPAALFSAVLFAVLPIHAETIATTATGRADSMPTLFYLATFLAYVRWRRGAARWTYLVAVGLFFLALYSKQSAITMVATLALYDIVALGLPLRPSWGGIRPYLPFCALTGGYLALRYVLFGQAAREGEVSSETLLGFGQLQLAHLWMLLTGMSLPRGYQPGPRDGLAGLLLAAAGLLLVALTLLAVGWARRAHRRAPEAASPRALAALVYFGPVWWMVSILPLVVTYQAPRHLYLASVGYVTMLGLGLEHWWRRGVLGRRAAPVLGAVLILASMLALERALDETGAAAALSGRILQELQREAAAAPSGALILVDAPSRGANDWYRTWIWAWALPFAAHPPFLAADAAERVVIIGTPDIDCCPAEQWFARTRQQLASWLRGPGRASVIVLSWDAASGQLSRYTSREVPALADEAAGLAGAENPRALSRRVDALLARLAKRAEEKPAP